MTLTCNCDMPAEIYYDWLQDQGWDCDEIRESEEAVPTFSRYENGNGLGNGSSIYCGHGYCYDAAHFSNERIYGGGSRSISRGGFGPSLSGDAQ